MAMEFVKLSPHDDVVHDISFDFYGRRFATCASDKRIKVWDLVEETGEWTCYDINRAHNDSIWRLSWAHPEFGQLIASCSEDKSICIWEEQESVTLLKSEQRDRWQKKIQLSDSKKTVNDVKFAPRHLGLKVAAASADGTVRIYEATDVFSLNYWQLQVGLANIIIGHQPTNTADLQYSSYVLLFLHTKLNLYLSSDVLKILQVNFDYILSSIT